MFYRFLRFFIGIPVFAVLFRPRVIGLDRVPRTGPVILAANHLSLVDPVLLSAIVPRPVTYVAKAEWWTRPGLRGRATAALMTGIHQVPIDRSGGRAARGALAAAAVVLADGGVFGIFPEGTRSPDGLLHRGRTGVARIALAGGVAVVPVGIVGTDAIMAPGSTRIRRARPTVLFGEPIRVTADPSAGQVAARELTDRIMDAIRGLSGQQGDDSDARVVTARRAAAARSSESARSAESARSGESGGSGGSAQPDAG